MRISERTARAHLAVAHALRRLPVVRRAFARGQLSYAKVRALCRVADADTERGWVERAHTSTADELEDLVTSHRQRHADPHAEHRARRLRWRTRADGMVTFSAVMPAHDAARVTAALHAVRVSLDATTPAGTDSPQSPPASSEVETPATDLDALIALADAYFHHDPPALVNPGHTLDVHLETPDAGSVNPPAEGGEDRRERMQGTISGVLGPRIGLPATVLARLGCDARVRDLHTDEHDNPLRLGRRRRHPTQRLRDAVYLRDRGRCRYPGCRRTRWLQIHHTLDWDHGGNTDIDRLVLICSRHHRMLHDEHITLRRAADNTVDAVRPDATTIANTPPALTILDLDAFGYLTGEGGD